MANAFIQISDDIFLTEYRATDAPALVQYLNEMGVLKNERVLPLRCCQTPLKANPLANNLSVTPSFFNTPYIDVNFYALLKNT